MVCVLFPALRLIMVFERFSGEFSEGSMVYLCKMETGVSGTIRFRYT